MIKDSMNKVQYEKQRQLNTVSSQHGNCDLLPVNDHLQDLDML